MLINTENSSFKRVEKFRWLRTTLTNQNSIQKEITSRLKSGNACYHSVQNLLSSSLLSNNIKITIHRTIILPVVLYGCETWSLTLREERTLRMFENRVLRRILGPRRDEKTGKWRKPHNEELHDLCSSANIIRVMKSRRMRCKGHVTHMRDRKGAYRPMVGNLWEKDLLEDPRLDGRITLKWILSGMGGDGLDLSGSGQGQVAGTSKGGNEPPSSIKRGEFLD